mmetsp:Transcript_53867/g.89620  ORF Transcript_53867/g.89620 Transcript_53867/m.89620 type:complete len:258 (-) Transcript_53867:1415-2188(-)
MCSLAFTFLTIGSSSLSSFFSFFLTPHDDGGGRLAGAEGLPAGPWLALRLMLLLLLFVLLGLIGPRLGTDEQAGPRCGMGLEHRAAGLECTSRVNPTFLCSMPDHATCRGGLQSSFSEVPSFSLRSERRPAVGLLSSAILVLLFHGGRPPWPSRSCLEPQVGKRSGGDSKRREMAPGGGTSSRLRSDSISSAFTVHTSAFTSAFTVFLGGYGTDLLDFCMTVLGCDGTPTLGLQDLGGGWIGGCVGSCRGSVSLFCV